MIGEPHQEPGSGSTLAQRSLEQLEKIMPSAPVLVWTAAPDGEMGAQSQQFLRYIGLEVLALPGSDWQRFVHPDDLDRVLAVWTGALEAESSYSCEYRVRHHSGEYRWLLFDANPVRGPGGAVDSWIGTAVERHAEHVAEAELGRAAALLRTASRLGRLGAWSLDLRTGGLEWSEEVRELHGVDADFVPAVETAIEFYIPDDRPLVEAALEACIDRGQPYDLELRIVTGAGLFRWCRTIGEAERNADGAVERLSGAFQDITDHKLAEVAVRESEERFRTLARATSDVVADWDLERGTAWYSDGLAELLMADPDEVSGPSASTAPLGVLAPWIHPDDADRVAAEMAEVLASGDDEWETSFRVLRHDGSVIELTVTGWSIRGVDGRVARLVASVVDTTAEHDFERRLARSQRLEAIGQLTGGIAHDFNNLLSVVSGGVDLLARTAVADTPEAEVLERIRSAADRGAELTRRLLAFGRQQPLEPRPVDLSELLRSVEGLVSSVIGDHIELEIELDDGRGGPVPPALIDPGQLENALVNLCLNSRDAMPDGGRLLVRARAAMLDATASGEPVRPAVAVEVIDEGVGMSPDVVEQVLEPFFTTKAPGQGTGLGLSMVYGFVRQSAGSMAIESEPGLGTIVRLVLPATELTPVPSSDRAVPGPGSTAVVDVAPGASTQPVLSILVVEDDPLVRSVVISQLQALGHRVLEAADGPSALEVLCRPADDVPIEVLFTDLVMPGGLDGRALAERALELRHDLSVLFTTGYAGGTSLDAMPDGEPMDVLAKPYRLDDLQRRLVEIATHRTRPR